MSGRRAAVERFADSMESALRRNDALKGERGWEGFPREALLARLKEEVAELEIALRADGRAQVRKEAADVANFAMMISEESPDAASQHRPHGGHRMRIEGLDAYQEAARRTDAKNSYQGEPQRLACYGLGLTGEAGEFAEHVKKHLFHGHTLDTEKAGKELGDVLWYLAMAADALGLSLSEVANMNIDKLRLRYPDGFTRPASIARADD